MRTGRISRLFSDHEAREQDSEEAVRYRFVITERHTAGTNGVPDYIQRETELDFHPLTSWPSVLHEFAKLLGSHYGYDIIKDITVKGINLSEAAYGYDTIKPVSQDKKKKAGTE